jgi:glycosyltransferase involved in cell wall biosynthesis
VSPRLCLLTQYFPPEMGAPQGRLSELGERLIDRGWEVEALTALPNYPTGKIFEGYEARRPRVEQVGRIRTVRVPLIPSKGGFTKRLASYFSFVAAASWWGPKLCERPDLIFVESPPLFIGYAARYLSSRWKCPFIFNVSDLWPDSAVDMGIVRKDSLAVSLASRLEHSLYAEAAGITGQTDDIISTVRERAGSKPTAVITNSVDAQRFGKDRIDDATRALIGPAPGPIFMYAGLLGLAQGLDQILDVAKVLPASLPGRFVLVGDGPVREHLIERVARERIDRVRIVPMQPRERVPSLLAAADAALITLGGKIHGAVPNKIYEAMASSLPIIIVAEGEAVRRVVEVGAGLGVPPNDTPALLAACRILIADPEQRARYGKRGRAAAETIYSRDRVAETLDNFLRSLLPEHPA